MRNFFLVQILKNRKSLTVPFFSPLIWKNLIFYLIFVNKSDIKRLQSKKEMNLFVYLMFFCEVFSKFPLSQTVFRICRNRWSPKNDQISEKFSKLCLLIRQKVIFDVLLEKKKFCDSDSRELMCVITSKSHILKMNSTQ